MANAVAAENILFKVLRIGLLCIEMSNESHFIIGEQRIATQDLLLFFSVSGTAK